MDAIAAASDSLPAAADGWIAGSDADAGGVATAGNEGIVGSNDIGAASLASTGESTAGC